MPKPLAREIILAHFYAKALEEVSKMSTMERNDLTVEQLMSLMMTLGRGNNIRASECHTFLMTAPATLLGVTER